MPVVPVTFPGKPRLSFLGLVDSGASGTRVPAELAGELGVDLQGAQEETFYAGAQRYRSLVAEVDLTIGKHTRPTLVSFTENWQPGHFLLGIRGFFQNYVVRIDAPRAITTLTPTRRGMSP